MPALAHGLAEDRVLHEMVQRLVAAIGPERIYLFGSRARGDHRQESDYDLLIVVAEARAWIATAHHDLRAASVLLAADHRGLMPAGP